MGEVYVEVIFFAKARELVGYSSRPLKVNPSTTLTALKSLIKAAFPPLEKLGDAFIVALNEDYLESDNITLSQGDEIAIIPPISGG